MPVLREMVARLLLPLELECPDEATATATAKKWERMGYTAYPASQLAKGGWIWVCRVEEPEGVSDE